ncbi:MAG: hypothetical protein IT385_21385, partial [Deltaproteobacteria bacterium]|nr:hypothetical protein [Deltaproteobacteria bacterium]
MAQPESIAPITTLTSIDLISTSVVEDVGGDRGIRSCRPARRGANARAAPTGLAGCAVAGEALAPSCLAAPTKDELMRFDDFTDAARRAIEDANAIAVRERHPQLTSEQLLLTRLDQRDTDALRVLVYLGTATATLRQALADEVASFARVQQERLVIAPALLRILEQARANARADGAPATSTAHLLGAIAYIGGTRAQAALVGSGAT